MAGPRIGILSDTHDNKWAQQAVLERFRAAEVGLVIHGGDYVAPFNARLYAGIGCPFTGVFGNNDGERVGLVKAFSDVGKIHVGPHPLREEGRLLLVMHEPGALEALARSGEFDVVIYGHTHALDVRIVPHANGRGQTLVVNPGEASGWLHDRATAVLLDLETLEPEVIEVAHHP